MRSHPVLSQAPATEKDTGKTADFYFLSKDHKYQIIGY